MALDFPSEGLYEGYEYEYISPDGNVITYVWDGQAWNAEADFVTGPKGEKGQKGEQGIQGDPFVWDDFTWDQLDSIKGEKGEVGIQGDPFTWDDFTYEQLDSIKGEKGQKGEWKGEKGKPGERGQDGTNGRDGNDGRDGTNSPEAVNATPNTLVKRDGSGVVNGVIVKATTNLSSDGGCVLTGDLSCNAAGIRNLMRCETAEATSKVQTIEVQFKNSGNGAFRWVPERNADKLHLRTSSDGQTFYYSTTQVGWTPLQKASDPTLKNIKEKGTYTAPFDFNDIEVIDFERDDDALAYAGLDILHASGAVYTVFNAENIEQLMPGSTIESNYLPQEDETINPGTYKSIPGTTELSLLAMCVREIQLLKKEISTLKGEGD